MEVELRLTPAADALLHTNVPVIAAVNGAAVGWGMELALMADLRAVPRLAAGVTTMRAALFAGLKSCSTPSGA